MARKYEVPPLGGPRGPGVRTVREMVGDKGPAPSRGRVEGGVGAMAARRTGVFGRQGMLVTLARAASGHWEQVRVEQQIAWAERSREELWLWKGDRGGWRWRTEEGREGMSSVPRPGSDTCLSPGCHNNSPTGLPAQVPSSRPGPSGSGRAPGVSLPPLSHAPHSTQRFHRRLTLPVSWWEAEHPARPLPPPWGWRASLSSCPAAQPASWWDSISLICAYLQPQEPWVPGHCAHQSRCVRVLGPPNQLPGWRPDNRCSFSPSSGDQKSKAGGLQSRFLLGCEEQLPQPLPGFLGWAGHLVVLGLWLVASDLCPCCHTAFTLCVRLCVSFFLFRRTPDILD